MDDDKLIWTGKDDAINLFQEDQALEFVSLKPIGYAHSRVHSLISLYQEFCRFCARNYARPDYMPRCEDDECRNCQHYWATKELCLGLLGGDNPKSTAEIDRIRAIWNDACDKPCHWWPNLFEPENNVDPWLALQALAETKDRQRAYSQYIKLQFQRFGKIAPGFDNRDLQRFYEKRGL